MHTSAFGLSPCLSCASTVSRPCLDRVSTDTLSTPRHVDRSTCTQRPPTDDLSGHRVAPDSPPARSPLSLRYRRSAAVSPLLLSAPHRIVQSGCALRSIGDDGRFLSVRGSSQSVAVASQCRRRRRRRRRARWVATTDLPARCWTSSLARCQVKLVAVADVGRDVSRRHATTGGGTQSCWI